MERLTSNDNVKYSHHCLKMMMLFHEFFEIDKTIKNTNPLDSRRLQELENEQRICLAIYSEHNNYTLQYE